MRCKLCQRESQIAESHVIPRFVGKWLKDSSATGYIRQAVNPNLRKQDIPTIRLLCPDCEARFSRWEKQFAEVVFFPFQEEGKREFDYADWLLLFAISLSWRVGIAELESFRTFKPNLVSHLEEAVSIWGNFLLGKPSASERYAHHLLFLDFVAHTEGIELPDGFHWYILRSIDATVPASSKEVAVYVKLPSMVFFSGVHPAKPAGWKNTQILNRGRIIASRQEVRLDRFVEFLINRAIRAISPMDAMSERQYEKISEAMTKDPERNLRSRSFQANLAELYWKKKQERSE